MTKRAIVATMVFMTTACGGPVIPLQVGTQTVPVAVVLGQREAVQQAPSAPIALPPPIAVGPPVIVRVTPPPATPTPTATPTTPSPVDPGPCPDFSPVDPVVAADGTIPAPPAPATYPYRTSITATAGEVEETYEGDVDWTISEPTEPGTQGEYRFEVAVTIDGTDVTTTTYLVAPDGVTLSNETVEGTVEGVTGPLPPKPSVALQSGMYTESVEAPDGSIFRPQPPLLVAPFPMITGEAYNVAATDGDTSISYVLSIGERVKVNACGTPVQGWRVDLTDGRYDTVASNGTAQTATFTRTITLATQYGGLIVEDQSLIEGTTFAGGNNTRAEHFTINVLPEPAQPHTPQ